MTTKSQRQQRNKGQEVVHEESILTEAKLTPQPDSPALPAEWENLRAALMAELTNTLSTLISSALEKALAPISASLSSIRQLADSQNQRLTDLESALSSYSDRIVSMEESLSQLQTENKRLIDKVDDLENRSRRSNMRIIGLPEGVEGSDARGFVADLLPKILGQECVPTPPVLDRAHRIGRSDDARSKSRAMIVRFHYFQDKEKVLRRSRELADQLTFQGRKISFFSDFSTHIIQKRAGFKQVKSRLYERGLKFGVQYPARLWVLLDNKRHFFDKPQEAQGFKVAEQVGFSVNASPESQYSLT
ncbi:hypothetical protein SRHO_G00211340 [Serrasalmus rhombeus]